MATLWRITALMLSGFMGFIKAVSVCDVVNPLGAHDFCKYLTGSPELSDFNDRTSNITILAFNNATKTSESSFGDMSDPERNAFLRYHIIRGIHSSQTLVKAQMDTISNMTILETYLSGEGLANVTDGQKLEYLIIDPGDESSNYSSFTTGIDVAGVDTMDQKFDGGLIHILTNMIEIPSNFSKMIPKLERLSEGNISISLFQEALSLTGLLNEIDTLGNITILAPQDTAFYRVGSVFDDSMSIDKLRSLLMYHILVENITYVADLQNSTVSLWVSRTLLGQEVNIKLNKTLKIDSTFATRGDLVLANGNLLLLEDLLDPENPTGQTFPGARTKYSSQPFFDNIINATKYSTTSTSPKPSNTASASSTSHSVSPPKNSHRLSKGVAAGIGIGVSICIFAIVGLIAWTMHRRKKATMVQKEPEDRGSDDLNGNARVQPRAELEDEHTRHELCEETVL